MADPVLKYPAPELRQKAAPVEKIGESTFRLVERMIETMIAEEGLGLAANQVGSLQQVFILNANPGEGEAEAIVCINPVILEQEGEDASEEGCLSFPDLFLKIVRPEKVCLQAKNLYNETFLLDLTGIMARAAMHEMDHLNGVLLIDHAAEADRGAVERYTEDITRKSDAGRGA